MYKKMTRHRQILELLALKERLEVENLAKILDVTTMTVRRDLAELEEKGQLTRTHGGCVPALTIKFERSPGEQDDTYLYSHAIARAAIPLIANHETVYLDSDRVAISLARLLPLNREVRILTNHLPAAMELFAYMHRGKTLEVIVLGGELATGSPDLVGEMVPMRLAEFCIDVAILGVDAVDPHRGEFSKNDISMATLSRAARARARRTLVLADHTKVGRNSLAVVGQFGPDITFVTDKELDPADRELIESTGANMVLGED